MIIFMRKPWHILPSQCSLLIHDTASSMTATYIPNSPLKRAIIDPIVENIDSAKAMEKVIEKEVDITVMNNTRDQLLHENFRMSTFIKGRKKAAETSNVKIIEGAGRHYYLTKMMKMGLFYRLADHFAAS